MRTRATNATCTVGTQTRCASISAYRKTDPSGQLAQARWARARPGLTLAAADLQSPPEFKQLRPRLQQEWHTKKNKHLGTSQQNPFSFAVAVWKCPDCHNEWQARIIDRAYREAGCQECAKGMSCAQSKLAFMSQWSHISNGLAGIYPDQVSIDSHKKIFWICRKCPQKWAHEWQESPFERAQHPHSCCPQCQGQQACICNDAPRMA